MPSRTEPHSRANHQHRRYNILFGLPICLVIFTCLTIGSIGRSWAQNAASEVNSETVEAPISDEARQLFENEIRPIFVEHCYECHGPDTAEAGLRLDSRHGWATGGDNGPAIIPGEPAKSLLLKAVGYADVDLRMPPEGKLSETQIARLERWVEQGAVDPRRDATPSTDSSEASTSDAAIDIEGRMRDHWAWHPVVPPALPMIEKKNWPLDPLDHFVLAQLERQKLQPAAPADKHAWLRRVTFDLIGLPPTLAELQNFLDDDSPEAYARVVDRLLKSPHYGEHWGQHWLDLCRFAETRGHEQDFPIDNAYRFRDYVVLAMNQDVPYDELIREHIAGDLHPHPRLHPVDHSNQSIQGTGFWHFHEATHSPVDIRGDEADRVQNQLDVFSRTFLGLSLGCARCHDHKFDPIMTRDYYAMFGFLRSSGYQQADVSDPDQQRDIYRQLDALQISSAKIIRQQVAAAYRERLPAWDRYLLDAMTGNSTVTSAPAADHAAEHAIDSETLSQLADHLQHTTNPADSPLFALAQLAKHSPDEVGLAQIQDATDRVRQAANDHRAASHKAWERFEIVEDFSQNTSGHWITSGLRFGTEPSRVGDLLLGDSAARPILCVAQSPTAEADRVSRRLSGFLRTRTFEITQGKLWYRYRGNAEVFLAVDSHRVVAGPLHGVLKQNLRGEGTQWKWFAHPAQDYLGHRAHVEFRPQEGFALDCVLFGDTEPPQRDHAIDAVLARMNQPATLQHVVSQTIEAFLAAVDAWSQDNVTHQDAMLVQWLLDHDDLLPPAAAPAAELESAITTYVKQRSELESQLPAPVLAVTMLDGSGENESIHIRGNHRNRSPSQVPRTTLVAFGGESTVRPATGSGRWELAESLTDPDNPLVARVMTNRIWYHMFGKGIVETVDDFGAMGKAPSHPELLDHLATRFREEGWSIKRMIRAIALSQTYRMSSRPADPAAETADPANVLLHRMNVRRLPAESIRDHILFVAGTLDPTMYGPSIPVHITPFMRGNRSPGHSGPLDGAGRRSIYTEVRRNHLSAFLNTFDKPSPFMAIGKRTQSNSPLQALILMNDPFVHEQAGHWAAQLLKNPTLTDDQQRLTHAYLQAFSRAPSPSENQAAQQFLLNHTARLAQDGIADPQQSAWRDLCHTLINVKEFYHNY
jgi:hypothetical protein